VLSDAFAKGAFPGSFESMCHQSGLGMCVSPEAYGVTIGVIACSMLGLWSALHFWLAAKTIRQDFLH
jgi:hypothetical protein